MRRELAMTAVAVIAACAQEGSSANGQTSPSTPEGLAYFHVAESGEGRVSFGSSRTEGAVQVLSDVVIEGEDGEELRAETLRIAGARETADGAVFDLLEVLNLTATDEEGGTASLNRLVVERPNALLASFIAQTLSSEGVDEDADWGGVSDYAFQALALEGFSAAFEGGQLAFDTLRFSDYASSVLGGFAFENLIGAGEGDDGTAVTFELAAFVMNGLDLSGAEALEDVDIEDEEAFEKAIVEAGFSDPFRKHYDDYAIEGLRVDVDGVMVSLASFAGQARQTRVGVETDDALAGLVVEFDPERELGAQGLEALALLGYDRVEINMNVSQTADQVRDRVASDDYVFQAIDAFSLEFDYDIGGLQLYLQNAMEQGLAASFDDMDPDDMALLLGPLVIHGLELRLIDDSIVERSLQAAATAQKSTPEAVRQQAIAFMSVATLMAPPGPVQVLVGEAIAAASDFLEEPGTLRIALEPEEPVSFADIFAAIENETPEQALALLNITVEAQ